jgi:hypothetical protein
MGTDLDTGVLPFCIRYKEFPDSFVMIYNNNFYDSSNLFQVKITLYLKNSAQSGNIVADFGTIMDSDNNTQLGISFGTINEANIIQGINFLSFTSYDKYIFSYPNSPNLNVTNIQSNYSNKQLIIILNSYSYPCFKEDSKILTNNGYKPIQDLQKGDLVQTLLHGFKAIVMIGKREIFHPASYNRIKEQLYVYNPSEYLEIFEPLVLTGCHSILVDDFINKEQMNKAIEVNGDLYITDNKYRLPASIDTRASILNESGTYTIYHLALENEDYYMNYGIYANGLLVESCSKRNLKELSNMSIIE